MTVRRDAMRVAAIQVRSLNGHPDANFANAATITGLGSEIGHALACRLAAEGCAVRGSKPVTQLSPLARMGVAVLPFVGEGPRFRTTGVVVAIAAVWLQKFVEEVPQVGTSARSDDPQTLEVRW